MHENDKRILTKADGRRGQKGEKGEKDKKKVEDDAAVNLLSRAE